MDIPKITNYTGRNTPAWAVELGDITVFYSYETPIGFHVQGRGYTIRANQWGPTTGRHMQEIVRHDPADRLPSADFERALSNLFAHIQDCHLCEHWQREHQ